MSDFPENNSQNEINQSVADENVGNGTPEENTEEESTVFSAPVEHKDKAKKSGKKRLVSVIASALAVAVLIGGTVAVIKLIPELKEEETTSSIFEDISVIDRDSSTFTSVDVTNTNGTFNFVTKEITSTDDNGETTTSTYWDVEDIDISKLSTDATNSVISSAASVTAVREITTKTAEECGFDNSLIKVSVTDETNGSYAFLVGDESPDGLGYYFMLDGSDKIYVVQTSELSDFQFEALDLSDKTAIPTTLFTTDTSENKEEDGSYAYFDSLTLSGKLYGDTLTIQNNNDDNSTAEVMTYIITTPTKRYANSENLSSLVSLFSNSITVSGNYAFDVTDQTLKEVGLDDPDAIVTMTINGESKSFKISVVDDEYCAVIYDGATMIRKVSIDSFAFLSLSITDFYSITPFMYSINDLSALKLTDSDYSVKFDISSTTDDESSTTYHISVDGKEIVASDFQNFYADFVGTQCNDFKIEDVSGEPEGVITFTFTDGTDTSVEFYRINETKYQFNINGTPMGRVTSASYKKIVKSIKAQAENVSAE